MANRFIDRLKFLDVSATKVDNLRQQVNQMLSRVLPQRVLSRVNIFEMILNVVQDIFSLNMFYVEDSLQENNLLTAKNESSVRGLGELSGHTAIRPQSSRGAVKFNILPGLQQLTPQLLIDNLRLTNRTNNLTYSMVNPENTQRINTDNNSFIINLIEGVWKEQVFVGDGTALFVINLDDSNPIENDTFEIRVDGELYSRFDSLYDMGSTTKGYLIKNGLSNQVNIIFGDNTFGLMLRQGASISVKYITTNGENGNLTSVSDTTSFTVVDGIFDTNGDSIDISQNVRVEYESGFNLGSFGEHIEVTRNIAGYSSRANVFARPENMKAFLSRLSILSHIDVWTDEDDFIFNVLVLPNIIQKINTYSDYLTLSDSALTLNQNERTEIRRYIQTSERQMSSSEIVYVDPILEKYAVFVYVDATIFDIQIFKNKVFDEISRIMIEETFGDIDLSVEKIISKSKMVNSIFELPEVRNVSLNIISEANEVARIAGSMETVTTGNSSGFAGQLVTQVESQQEFSTVDVQTTIVPATTNPNIGFTDLGNIKTVGRQRIPVLRGGFQKFNGEGNPSVSITKPIYIFTKQNNTWREI